jgi:hypothetical protein
VHLKVVQDVLGHSQITLTADTYSHVAAPQRRDAAERLQSALVPERAPESADVGVSEGVNLAIDDGDFAKLLGKMVSPEGIEPSTNRLRV